MADLFVSYAHEDETRVRELVQALEDQGCSTFWDHRIPAGETWRSYIGKAMDAASCILVVWSDSSIRSSWVTEEADEGKRRGILIPVLIHRVLPPPGFREIQAADLTGWHPGSPSDRFDTLVADVCRCLGRKPRHSTSDLSSRSPDLPARQGKRRARSWVFIAAGVASLALSIAIGRSVCSNDQHPAHKPPPQSVAPITEPRTATEPKAQWLVIAGSFPLTNINDSDKRVQMLARAGISAVSINTSDYPHLRPNLRAVVVGPFLSREEADHALDRVRNVVPGAYVKQGR